MTSTMTMRSSPNSTIDINKTKSLPYKSPTRYIGKQQPTSTRLPEKASVDYAKGGSDFRTPHNTSSIGKQVLGTTSGRVSIAQAERFTKSDNIGTGPNLGQISSMKKQIMSSRASAASCGFGTSTRDAGLKQYSLYTSTRR